MPSTKPFQFLGYILILAVNAPLASHAQVKVRIALQGEDALAVSYQLPASCQQLHFTKNGAGAAEIRQRWQSQNSCFKVDGEQLLRSEKNREEICKQAQYLVKASYDKVTGYPAAYPMAKAIYLHTSNYQVSDNCGPVSYEFVAPFIALEGRVEQQRALMQTKPETSFPALLTTVAPQVDNGVISHLDPRLGEANIQQLQDVAQATIRYLHQALPAAHFAMPIVAAAYVDSPGEVGYNGDAGNVLRLGLLNWPVQPNAEEKRALTKFVSHEFAHRFQLRDEVDRYPIARVIHEGGGEFLRWSTSIALGWLSHQQAANELDQALTECILGTGQRAWQSLSASYTGSRRLEYACGLPSYVYALASRRASTPRASAMQHFGHFYEKIQAGQFPDFSDSIECGEQNDCHATWLPQLYNSAMPMPEVWQAMLTETRLAKAVVPNQAQMNTMVGQAFAQLMHDDCGENSSFGAPDGVIIDDVKTCKTLKPAMKIVAIEGYPMFNHRQTLAAMIQACKTKQVVQLGVKNASSIAVPCSKAYLMIEKFYAVDIEQVVERLK